MKFFVERRAVGRWGRHCGGSKTCVLHHGMNFEKVSNEALLQSLEMFVGVERRAIAKMLAYLVEVEDRRLHLELSYSSMYDFCQRRLELSENEAYRRIAAARLVRKFPVVFEALRSGSVTLTNVVLLRDLFTAENVVGLVLEIAGKTRREVEALVARMQPKPDVPDSVTVVGAQPQLAALSCGLAVPTVAVASPVARAPST